MSRTWVLVVLAAIIVAEYATGPHQGFNSSCVNGQCYMTASTSLLSVVASVALIAFMLLYPQERGTAMHVDAVKFWERFIAFFIDFFVVLSAFGPTATLPILFAEAETTGVFQWSFERDFSRPTDATLEFPGVLALFIALFLYFYIHPKIGRQTIGQYLMGFRIEGAAGAQKPNFALNAFLGYVGLCMWPISLFVAAKRPDKLFWWNLRTNTRVVRVV